MDLPPKADTEFFLQAPPRFLPFRRREPVRIYTRKLPHWRQPGCTYFVTFRLADSLPASALRDIVAKRERWEKEHPPPHDEHLREKKANLLSQLEENWLDAGHGDCLFGLREARDILEDKLRQGAPDHMETMAYVCMPNHAHGLLRPLRGMKLEEGLKRIKGGSAVEVNRALGRSGSLWFGESFDRIVRDRRHLWRCLQYIGNNPSKAKLRAGSHSRWVCEDWESAGWKFKTREIIR